MRFIVFLLFFSFLFSCKNEVDPLLFGKWKGAEWLVQGKTSDRNVDDVAFEFNEDGSFSAAYGNQLEKGTFDLNGDQLVTNSEGQLQKMVKILQLTQDTLSFQMNRVGQGEILVLVREKD